MSVVDVSAYFAGVDPLAETKTVIFRPDEPTDTIRVGDLVCYNWDLETDWKERGTNPSDRGATYAEGSQNYSGRLFVVEKPATANLHAFAGVVAKLGPLAGADGDTIAIYKPNGAVVPVMIDMDTTKGVTIVGVRNGAYEGSYPGRPIGIAMETATGNTTDTLCWVKVDPNRFIWQEGNNTALTIDDEGSSDATLNKIKITSAQTTGCPNVLSIVLNTVNTDGGSAMYWEYGNTGTGAGGMKLINAYVEAAGTAIAADVVGMKMQVNLLADAATTTASTAMAIFAKTEIKSGAGTIAGDVFAGRFCLGLGADPTGTTAQLQFEHTGGNYVDYFFEAVHAASIAYTANTTHSSPNKAGVIKIQIAGVDHYIYTFSDAGA